MATLRFSLLWLRVFGHMATLRFSLLVPMTTLRLRVFSFFFFLRGLSSSELSSVDVSRRSSSESMSEPEDLFSSLSVSSRSSSETSSTSSFETSILSDSSSSLTLSKSSFLARLTLIFCLLRSPSALFLSFKTSFFLISFSLAVKFSEAFFLPSFLISFGLLFA